MSFISYSQNFEDFMLWRALKNIHNGYYIDVGGYDPTLDSVTKNFYDSGWSGVNIEPVISYYDKFLLERPRDVNLNILISDSEGETIFYENEKTGISSVVEDNIKSWENELNFEFKKLKKNAKKLDTVCEENKVKIIHFLKIDVEGFEINVLRSFSFDRIRPWIVVFEAVNPIGKHEDISSDCVSYLISKNYHQVYFDGLNKFFISNEHKELDEYFSVPLNVFDQADIKLNNSHWLIHNNISEIEQIYQQKEKEIIVIKQKIIDEMKAKSDLTLDNLASNAKELNSAKSLIELKNNELFEIYNSKGWELIVFIRKTVNTLIPKGSFGRKVVKFCLKIIRKIKRLYIFLKQNSKKITTNSVSDKLENLSPRARKIYNNLNMAIKFHKKNK